MPYHCQYYPPKRPRRYGLSNLIGDVTLVFLTGGLWILWIVGREFLR